MLCDICCAGHSKWLAHPNLRIPLQPCWSTLNETVKPNRRQVIADELRPRLMRIGVAMRREMKSAPVTVAQSAVLSALLIGGAMRVSDLARNEGVKLPTMTQIVGRMEIAGLVSRAGPSGSYNNLIHITPKGAAVARKLAKQRTELLVQRMATLDSDELNLLHKLVSILDKMFRQEPWSDTQV